MENAVRPCTNISYRAKLKYEFVSNGARFPSHNTIVGSGENGCILHYTEKRMPDERRGFALIDAGCEIEGYAGDITRTFPVNGKFSKRAARNL